MNHIKSIKEHMLDISKFVEKMKSKYDEFAIALKSQGREARIAYDLIGKAAKGQLVGEDGKKRSLNEEEIKLIKEQSADALRLLGLTSIALLPGGTLVFVLLKAFKQEDMITPSSFKKKP